ncbi:hypothetical protein GBAR_LOCUS8723 [Geodia barretti]|uniref:Uncharacterized protein n=1 Tax=Geodia barretti TaxID=519541 RepID=A0AA35RMK4_GEOBA|nr:hypothetical protein GBAR_LOCUS8723 [Geodia barretti]
MRCDSQPKNPCDNMHVSVTGSVRNWMLSLSNNTLTGRFSATARGHPATALPLQKDRSLPGGRWRRTTDTQETRITQTLPLSQEEVVGEGDREGGSCEGK